MIRTPLIEKILNTAEIHKILIEKILSEYEKGQAEGESIHITDSSNLPMILRPQGQIIQDTRNGYNLYNINDMNTLNFATIEENDFIKASYDNTEGTGTKYSDIFTNKTTNVTANTDYYIISEIKEVSGTGIYFPCTSDFVNSLMASQVSYSFVNLHDGDIIINKIKTKEDFSGLSVFLRTIVKYETGQAGSITFRLSVIPASLGEITEENFEYEAFGQMPSTIFPSPIKNVEGNYKILNRNKNYFNFIENVDKQTYIGITISCCKNILKANGTSTQAGKPLVEPIQFLKKGYYKVFINLDRTKVINIDNHKAYAIYFRDSKNNIITGFASNTNINSNTSVINLKLDEDITLVTELFVNGAGITFKDLEIKIQIEKVEEDADTDIVEPELKELNLDIPEEIKLYGEKDGFIYLTEEQATELELNEEGWYIVNNYKERDFSKEPLLTGKTAGPFVQGYYIIFDDIKGRASLDGNIIYSTHQKQKIPANPSMDAEWLKLDGNLIGQLYPSTHIGVYINYAPETKQEFVDWFNNLAPIIIYPIKKPVYTKITDKHFIKQLEDLQKVFSHEGTTNIDTYSTDDKEKAPLIISAEYLKSQKIINKNLDERITALENALINNI